MQCDKECVAVVFSICLWLKLVWLKLVWLKLGSCWLVGLPATSIDIMINCKQPSNRSTGESSVVIPGKKYTYVINRGILHVHRPACLIV